MGKELTSPREFSTINMTQLKQNLWLHPCNLQPVVIVSEQTMQSSVEYGVLLAKAELFFSSSSANKAFLALSICFEFPSMYTSLEMQSSQILHTQNFSLSYSKPFPSMPRTFLIFFPLTGILIRMLCLKKYSTSLLMRSYVALVQQTLTSYLKRLTLKYAGYFCSSSLSIFYPISVNI